MSPEAAARLMRLASRASVTTAVVLVALKALAWSLSGAVAMLGSLTDSGLDLAASLVTLLAIRTALTPADENHRFGHGKAEALSGLFQAGLMGASAVFLALESLSHLITPVAAVATGWVVAVSAFSILVTLALVLFQAYVIRATGSLAVAGDHLHYKGDLALNIGVLLAAAASSVGYPLADGLAGLAIALYIARGCHHVARPAIDMLMDRELGADVRADIMDIAVTEAGVEGVHQLKTRGAGRGCFIQLHLEVDGAMTVAAGHAIADAVEAKLAKSFPLAEIIIHIDPHKHDAEAVGPEGADPAQHKEH